jgi:hypothetical protein
VFITDNFFSLCRREIMKLEKIFRSIRSLKSANGKARLCLACGNTATREALFNVGEELAPIERYCDTCMIKIN